MGCEPHGLAIGQENFSAGGLIIKFAKPLVTQPRLRIGKIIKLAGSGVPVRLSGELRDEPPHTDLNAVAPASADGDLPSSLTIGWIGRVAESQSVPTI